MGAGPSLSGSIHLQERWGLGRGPPGMEYFEKSGRVWENDTVLLPLGLDMPLATGEDDTLPLMVA